MSDVQPVAAELDPGGPFTLAEACEIEDLCDGVPMPELVATQPAHFTRAVAYIVGRRDNPNLTIADVDKLEVMY